MEDLEIKLTEATIVYEDNQAAISIAQNPQHHSKTKHIDIKHHFVREKVADNIIQLKYCPFNEMLADLLTKGVTFAKLVRLCEMCGVRDLSTYN